MDWVSARENRRTRGELEIGDICARACNRPYDKTDGVVAPAVENTLGDGETRLRAEVVGVPAKLVAVNVEPGAVGAAGLVVAAKGEGKGDIVLAAR